MQEDVYLDPKEFYAEELDNWTRYWDDEKTIYENVEALVDDCVFFPGRDVLLPIIANYILVPSKWARILGVMLCYGKEGSGKSTVSHLACKLHGQKQTFSATDTFASIRNALDKMRWLTEDKSMEREGVILCWDNIHSSTLKESKPIYQMLLFGYNRSSEKISIANSSGQNIDFYVFSPKILSSVDPIHLEPDFRELQRRLFLIPHKPWQYFLPKDKAQYEGRNISSRLDLDAINWNGIEDKFYEFWNNVDNVKLYPKLRTSLTRKNSQYSRNLPESITSERWTISVDLIVTGIITRCWASPTEAIEAIGKYWTYIDEVNQDGSATTSHVRNFIEEEVGVELEANQKLVDAGLSPNSIYVSPTKLKERLRYHQARGELDLNADTRTISQVMLSLGWRLTTKGWKQI